jgi:ketosteroid isomerase-like protein
MQRSQDNFQVVQGFFTSLEQRDRDAALASFDEHATWDTPAGGPFAGRFFGRAGIGRFLQLLALAHPDGHMVTELTLHAESDRVFAEFVWAPLTDSAPRVATRSLAVFQLVFNKINAVREFEAAPVGG